ncbi:MULTISPECIES: type II CAAX endopeptidase family protein [Methanobrevibacter]|uniref:CPBP family intramembrane glutamic endopeptidase n=1 Tax=Methanobrevibacter TaxID=2172 RepID=UPI0026EA93C7|nr:MULTISPECIES: type II CAAX endopeptidase family protein [Methanobrevibacter]MBS7257002.1 CPBP family intramembrane metalloprotease [Methanobrevibacter sp.]MCI7428087.1 CPBP family intramembrane metalloprotease [Methanobrevibacter sp.]MDY3096699.1 type II CAAX endopeptidase family protein [Methanobrevibacter sp.]
MNANKKFFSKIGFNYLAYSIASILFLIILSNIIAVIRPEILNNINIATIITAICNYVLPLPILLFLMRKLDSTEIKKNNLGFKTFLKYLCITFTLMWIGNITGTIITNLLSFTIQNDIANPIQNLINSTDLWLNLILISLIGPIFEEIIFRKILIDRTIKYGPLASILVSAIIFGLIHGNLNQFCYTVLVGGFFAYVYIKTGQIKYSIGLHIILNMLGSVLSMIVNNSAVNLSNAFNTTDLAILVFYFILILIALFVGIYTLVEYIQKKRKQKNSIDLKIIKPVFLNAGMICFIVFYIIRMALQILI